MIPYGPFFIAYAPVDEEKRCSVLGDYSRGYATRQAALAALRHLSTIRGDPHTYWVEGPLDCGHIHNDVVTLEDATICRPCARVLESEENVG